MKRVFPPPKPLRGFLLVTFGVMLINLRGGNRHGRIQKHLDRRDQPVLLNSLPHIEQKLLRPFEGEGRNDDIAAAMEAVVERRI